MNRAERRRFARLRRTQLGRDQEFKWANVPGSLEHEAALTQAMNATAKRGKESKGGQKRGSWGPEADG